jgi:hypothetical protein
LCGTFGDVARLGVVKSVQEQGVAAMRPLVVFGIMLIAIGIAGLAIDNISFTEKRTVIEAGPLKVTADQQRTIPIPTIAGVIAIVAGAGMIFFGRQAHRS